jgi:hypothetical protein
MNDVLSTYDDEGRHEMTKETLLLSLSVLVSMLILGHSTCVQADLESLDVGDAANKPGSTEILDDGTITVIGAGHDIWDNADGLRYVYTEVSGDFEAIVQITYFERVAGEPWAKAGLVARETVDPGAKNALSTAAAGDAYGVQLTWRPQTNGPTSELNYWEMGGPTRFNDGEWIRLTRSGDDFSASWSDDGVTWDDDYATVTIDMDETITVGLAVTGHDVAKSCEASFKNFTINGISAVSTAVSPCGKLPATWGETKSSH